MLKENAVKWLWHHMDHPLLVCVSDKKKQVLTFFSCLRLWCVLFTRSNVRSLKLRLKEGKAPFNPFEYGTLSPTDHLDVDIPLGKPILQKSLDELESKNGPADAYEVLAPWIRVDAGNIARRRLGGFALDHFIGWETNAKPDGIQRLYYPGGHPEKLDLIEMELAGLLTTVAHTSKLSQQDRKLAASREMLNQLDRKNLCEFERQVADGTLPP